MTNAQIEACRVAINRHLKRGGKLWIRIFPDKPITKKPAETRMGKGKGAPEAWVAVVKPGRIMFELNGVREKVAREAFLLAAHRLPVLTRFVAREEMGGGIMKIEKFREMTMDELDRKLVELQDAFFKLKIKVQTKQVENTAQVAGDPAGYCPRHRPCCGEPNRKGVETTMAAVARRRS